MKKYAASVSYSLVEKKESELTISELHSAWYTNANSKNEAISKVAIEFIECILSEYEWLNLDIDVIEIGE